MQTGWERDRATAKQNKFGTVSNADTNETSERWCGGYMGHSECFDTVVNWTELNPQRHLENLWIVSGKYKLHQWNEYLGVQNVDDAYFILFFSLSLKKSRFKKKKLRRRKKGTTSTFPFFFPCFFLFLNSIHSHVTFAKVAWKLSQKVPDMNRITEENKQVITLFLWIKGRHQIMRNQKLTPPSGSSSVPPPPPVAAPCAPSADLVWPAASPALQTIQYRKYNTTGLCCHVLNKNVHQMRYGGKIIQTFSCEQRHICVKQNNQDMG